MPLPDFETLEEEIPAGTPDFETLTEIGESVQHPVPKVIAPEGVPLEPPKLTITPYEQAQIESMRAGRPLPETGMEPGTAFTTSLATAAVTLPFKIKEALTPKKEIPFYNAPVTAEAAKPTEPRIRTEEEMEAIRKPAMAVAVGAPTVPAATYFEGPEERRERFATEIQQPAIPLPRFTVKPEDSIPITATKEVANMLIGLPEFFETPLGMLTMGYGATSKKAATLVRWAFAADMVKGLFEQSSELYNNWKTLSDQEKTRLIVGELGTATMLGLLTHPEARARVKVGMKDPGVLAPDIIRAGGLRFGAERLPIPLPPVMPAPVVPTGQAQPPKLPPEAERESQTLAALREAPAPTTAPLPVTPERPVFGQELRRPLPVEPGRVPATEPPVRPTEGRIPMPRHAEAIAQSLGVRFDSQNRGRWTFTTFDTKGNESTSFAVKAGASLDEVRKAYEDARKRYEGESDQPRPPKEVSPKEQEIQNRISAGIRDEHLQVTISPDQVDPDTGRTIPGTGYIQIDEIHPELGNTFSSNPDTLRKLGMNIPETAELLKLPKGKYSMPKVREMLKKPEPPTAPAAPPAPAAPEPQSVLSMMDHPPQEIKADQIATKADLMQFREGHTETGETRTDKLTGKWDDLKAGLLLLWEPKDPAQYGLTGNQKYIVANGHHRFAFGQSQSVPAYGAQVLREADGFSAQDARRIAAEANIADGKGTIYDQVKFLRNVEGARGANDEVGARNRIGAKGRQAATIAFDAADDTYGAFINEAITAEQAEAIASAAPKNAEAQEIGIRFAARTKDVDSLSALVRRAIDMAKGEPAQLDLFGRNDAALLKAVREEEIANRYREEIRERIRAQRGAAKRPEIAAEEGIFLKDPEASKARIQHLESELGRWKSWWSYPDLDELVRGKKPAAPPAPEPAPPVPPEAPAPPAPPVPPVAGPVPPKPPAPAPPVEPSPPIRPSGHFDKDKADAARDRLKKKKPPQPPPGIRRIVPGTERLQAAKAKGTGELFPKEPEEAALFDQETLNDLTIVGGELVEAGFIKYPEFYREMIASVGRDFRHYFRRAYNQVRDVDSLHELTRQMTPREEVELFNDEGVQIGAGTKHRPGLIVRDETFMPKVEEVVNPTTWVGPEGDSIDWTQAKAINSGMAVRIAGRPGMMIADGPGVGKSGVGAALAHLLTFPVRIPLDREMGRIWGTASPEARANWLLSKERGGKMPKMGMFATTEPWSQAQLDQMMAQSWENLRPEQKNKVYRNYGFTKEQIDKDNVNAGSKERLKVLIVATSKAHIETSFMPDFKKFGIPSDNIEWVTYDLLSKPGEEGTPQRKRFDEIMNQDWAAVIFDEAHALKNAGSAREHNSRKLKTPFRVFMTATPMDSVPNAVYFFAELTGLRRDQVMDALGLTRIVKVINGEDREFVVQKPGISMEDVRAQILKMRRKAISDGVMIRREFPWWGDVVGRDETPSLAKDIVRRLDTKNPYPDSRLWITPEQHADWLMGYEWAKASERQRAQWLLPGAVEGELPRGRPWPGGVQAARAAFTPAELERMRSTEWNSLRLEQKQKVVRSAGLDGTYDTWPEKVQQDYAKQAGYTPEEIEKNSVTRPGQPGPYYLDPLDEVEFAQQQQIYDKWQEAIDKSRNPLTRMRLSGNRTQELKRWAEQIKAKRILPLIEKEIKAGRKVVVFSNIINKHYVKGLGAKVWADVKGQPNSDWPLVDGALGYLAEQLKKMNIPFGQIFGPNKDIKTHGIRQFYGNKVDVALVTPESGGAGLNLDDVIGRYPRTIFILDIPWKGDAFEQSMYRVSRRNTASASKGHIIMIPNGFSDGEIRKKMNEKLRILRGIQAGEDTDLMGFIDDLSNPDEMKATDSNIPSGDIKGELPPLNWKEVKGRGGRSKWKADITPEFEKWWDANGQEKNPYGFKLRRETSFWGGQTVWSDYKPEFGEPKEPGVGDDPNLQASREGGYVNPPKYSGTPYDDLVRDMETLRSLIESGVEPERYKAQLAEMTRELDRRKSLDARTEALLLDDAEYNRFTQMMEQNPDSPDYAEWEYQRNEIAKDVAEQVRQTVPEPQAATAAPGIIPASIVPTSLTKPPESMDALMRKLRKGLGIPIRFKSWLGGGFFDPLLRYIRVGRVQDYGANLHEAGHALDAEFHFRDHPAVAAELDHLGDPTRPDSRSSWTPAKPLDYKLGEGVAEFVRYWIFDPAKATQLAPKMEKLWESVIDANEKQLGFMREIREGVRLFEASDPQMKLRSQIVIDDPTKRRTGIAHTIAAGIDELHFLKLATDDAGKGFGALKASQDPYVLFRLLRGSFGRADAWLRYGTVDARTGDISLGGSLMDAVEPVKGRINDFRDWITAVQAAEMARKGKEPGIPMDRVRATLSRFSSDPDFIESFRRLQVWQDKLLRYAVDGGLLTQDDYLRMKKENAIYIPMRRVYEVGIMEEAISGRAGTGRQLGRVGSPSSLKYRRGSERPIWDPLGSMVENAYFITFATEKQRALSALANLANLPGMGKWIGPYPGPVEKVRFQFGRIRSQLDQMGVDTSMVSDETLMAFWRASHKESTKDNVIRIRKGDSFEYFQLDPDLFKAVMAMDKFTIDKIMRWLAAPGQLLRAGVTLEPAFALRNALRDTVSAAVISRYTMVPFESALRGAWALLAPNILERIGYKTQADLLRAMKAEWKAAGAEHAIETAFFDRDKMKDFVKREISKDLNYKQRGLFWATHPLMLFRMLTQFGEEATRIGEYQKVFNTLTKKGWTRLDSHLQAAYEARDLQDFAMGGSASGLKFAKLVTPFWNAAIQGRYRFFRSLYDPRNPDIWKKTLLKGFGYITIAKMLEQYMNWDDEDYWSQPRWQRMMAFHIPRGRDKSGHQQFILLPVPFEAGLIFASFPGAVMEYIKQRDLNAVEAFGKTFAGQMIDNPIPQFITSLMEVKPELGYDFFMGRPIVPRGLERDPYWARWTDTTSLAAKKAGKILNVSPAKVEHIIRRSTGGMGLQIVHNGLDKLIGLKTGEKGSPIPVDPLRSIVAPPRGARSQIIDDFYQKLGELQREQTSRQKHHVRTPGMDVSKLAGMLATEEQMSELRKQYQGTYDTDKRQRLTLQMEKLARHWVRTKEGRYKGPYVKKPEQEPKITVDIPPGVE